MNNVVVSVVLALWSLPATPLSVTPLGEPAPITVLLIGLVAGCFIIRRRLD
ncbi:MAG: PEP-CTERM sorting domain-containing protein [Pseudomonadota bacterium]